MNEKLDEEIIGDCFDELHLVFQKYHLNGNRKEAYQAIVLLACTSTISDCYITGANLEQKIEELTNYINEVVHDEILTVRQFIAKWQKRG